MSIKIAFVIASSSERPLPSTRISVFNMYPFLRKAGYDPHVVFEQEEAGETPDIPDIAAQLLAQGFKIVYFQKVSGPSVERLVGRLCRVGIKTVFGVCDLVNEGMARATDITLVVTEYLKTLYPRELHRKISVVHDGIEHPERRKMTWSRHRGSRVRPLRAVLVSSSELDRLPVLGRPPEWLRVSIVARYPPLVQVLQRLRVTRWLYQAQPTKAKRLSYLRFCANPYIRCHAWDPEGVYGVMQKADIGIIPIEKTGVALEQSGTAVWQKKSENRLTMKMAVGLPVLATKIPSYESVIVPGQNGYFCQTVGDWFECLELLRDPDYRYWVGEQARMSVLARYSMAEQATKLVAALGELV